MNFDLNRTHITLAPKIPILETLDQFRPISLCNFAYKTISKVMVNRLKPWLSKLIAREQSAFVSGRLIQNNIMIVQEVLHQLRAKNRRKKFPAVLKLDMKEAYDKVEWDLLEACLRKLGFDEKWITWVMQCVSPVSFSVKYNGNPLPCFQPSRGLQQGDPLSPHLYILVANILSLILKKAVEDGSIKGIKLNSFSPTTSHLLFVDDSIFFLGGRIQECQSISDVSSVLFCYWTGDKPKQIRNTL